MWKIVYSIACVFLLGFLLLGFGRPLLTIALWVPPMSHVFHILFSEGIFKDGAPWYDSYEIAVFAEVVILRAFTTAVLFRKPYVILSAAGLALAAVLPFITGYYARGYDWVALVLDTCLIMADATNVYMKHRGQFGAVPGA